MKEKILIVGHPPTGKLNTIETQFKVWLKKHMLQDKVIIRTEELETSEPNPTNWVQKLIENENPTLVILEANLRNNDKDDNSYKDTFSQYFFCNANKSVSFILFAGTNYKNTDMVVGTQRLNDCKNVIGCFFNGGKPTLLDVLNKNEGDVKAMLSQLDIAEELL